jgi:hypothetical protein
MNDKQLANSLRSLPRATASPAFSSETLRTAKAKPETVTRPFVWRMAAGVAMAACLILVITLASIQQQRRQTVERLRAEQQQLSAELQAVKQIASEPEPVVVYENPDTRVIVDLDSAVQPASYRTFD